MILAIISARTVHDLVAFEVYFQEPPNLGWARKGGFEEQGQKFQLLENTGKR